MPLEARPDLITPEALARLRAALCTGERSGRLWLALRRLDAWASGATPVLAYDTGEGDHELDDQALALLSVQALTKLGLGAGPDWEARAAAFDARAHTPSEQAILARYIRIAGLKSRLAVPNPPTRSEDGADLRQRMDALYARQQDLQAHTTPGDVTAEALDGLAALLVAYRELRDEAASNPNLDSQLAFFAASAAFALGRGRVLSGDLRSAASAYAEAAELYGAAEEPDQAASSREEAERNRFAASADVDGASLADLRRMADGLLEPLERARTLMRLSERASQANDAPSALAHAQAAMDALTVAGFPDPLAPTSPPSSLPEVTGAWIDAAQTHLTGAPMMRLLNWVGATVLHLAALRWRVQGSTDATGAHAAFDALTAFLSQLVDEAARVHAEIRKGLEGFGIASPQASSDPAPSRTAEATEILRALGDATQTAQADGLVVRADALGLPLLEAQARLTQAILRLDGGDLAGTVAATQEGEARLLAGASARTLIGTPGFAVLLELRRQRLGALAADGDRQAVFDGAWETVQLIEDARYRISDPFQQAAFLSGRTAFYELATVSAFRLERWDDLLTVMDLFKARSLLRNRLAPAPPQDDGLAARLRGLTDAYNTAAPDARPALAAQRKALWTLMTVSRLSGAQAADLPALSVAAIQGALAPEEAAVAWTFVATDVLVVLALTDRALHAERIVLDDAQGRMLEGFVAAIQAGRANTRALGRTVSAIGAMLLPPGARAFIAGATRLILSPHRQLNLVPFHAARIDGAALITRASVRYAPNLGSLLMAGGGGGIGLGAVGLNRSDLPGWPPLAAAEAECRAVCAVWTERGLPAHALLGAAATVDEVLDFDLGSRRCLHLATHGGSVFLGDARQDPFDSYLVLRDAKLDALAISQLRLQADVVVLSACFSGQRALTLPGLESLPGDDLFGLQAAFFQAGARSVVGALWPLDDASAARILPRLHEGLAGGVAPDLALQEALKAECAAAAPDDIYRWAPLFLSSIGRPVAMA